MKNIASICGRSASLVVALAMALAVTLAPNLAVATTISDAPFDISGTVTVTRVTDGDSLRSGVLRIRLFGIDAPEIKQKCHDQTGMEWACGTAARDAVSQMIKDDGPVTCHLRDTDRYGRLVMQCFAGERDIAKQLVKRGLAMSYRRYSDLYNEDEEMAKTAGAGIWQGEFIPPWDWR